MKRILTTLFSVIMIIGGAKMYRVRDMSTYNAPDLMGISDTVHEFVNDEMAETIPPQEKLSTEKSTYISTDFSTEPTFATEGEFEPETETAVEARSYNGITEGEVIVGELTFYCCGSCCGRGDGLTASGYIVESGVQSYTASCGWLPFEAVIEIEGVEYTIRDRGGKRLDVVGRVDIYEPNGHETALLNGRRTGVEVKVVSLP